MIVSTDIRLSSMVSCLQNVVLPALEDNEFAADQVRLTIAHLRALREQSGYTHDFERLEYLYYRNLSRKVLERSDGGSATRSAADALDRELECPIPESATEFREAARTLSGTLVSFIQSQEVDGTPEAINWSNRAVLDGEHDQSLRDRAFFSPFNYDAGSTEIDSIKSMMTSFRIEAKNMEENTAK